VRIAAPSRGQDVDVAIAVNVGRDRLVRLQAALEFMFTPPLPASVGFSHGLARFLIS
jgi:hypothetical protein